MHSSPQRTRRSQRKTEKRVLEIFSSFLSVFFVIYVVNLYKFQPIQYHYREATASGVYVASGTIR